MASPFLLAWNPLHDQSGSQGSALAGLIVRYFSGMFRS